MCFFNSLSVNASALEKRFNAGFKEKEKFNPVSKGNAFGGISWPVITGEETQVINFQEWGLIPSWVKDVETAKKIRFQTLNARSETVFEKPSFRNSIKTRRCLIPSTGFYEWQHEGKKKIPWFIGIKDTDIFSMAGIWDEWVNLDTGEIFRGFSILTTKANSIMEKIHNTKKRMPVILLPEYERDWLKSDIDEKKVQDLCTSVEDKWVNATILS